MSELNYTAGDGQIRDFTPIPIPEVVAMVTNSEMKTTTKGGQMLALTWTVTQPEQYAGRLIFDNVNLQNANPVAERIGRAQLDTICRVIGLSHVQYTTDLHDKPVVLSICVIPEGPDKNGQFRKAKNEVKNYKSLDAANAAAASPAPRPTPPPQQKPAQPAAQWTPPAAAVAASGKPAWATGR